MTGLVVHDWIEKTGGAEKVGDAIAELFPDADIHCLWNDAPDRHPRHRVSESWLARTSLRRSKAALLPLMPLAWRRLYPHKHYDWILACSHLFAHHVSLRPPDRDIRKYVYAHTPARYIWTPEHDPRGKRLIPRILSPPLRALDRRRAQEIYKVAANSNFVRKRIERTWEVDATVIHPPVNVEQIQRAGSWSERITDDERKILGALPRPFLLGASRFVQYKRLDTVIDVGVASDLPVVIAGSGPEEKYLRAAAARSGAHVDFVIDPSNALLYALYQQSMAFVFPGVEDFGMMPIEAMAVGTPVIVNKTGGAAESVLDDVTGAHLRGTDRASMRDAVQAIDKISKGACSRHARTFDSSKFMDKIREWMGESLVL
jgi:glycosyltransferase involved in cell wall biosynthesis